MSAVFDSQQRSSELALAKERELAAEARSNLSWTLAEQQANNARFERSLRYSVIAAAGIALFVGLVFMRSIVNRKSAIAMATREHQLNVELNNRLAQQAAELEAEVATRRELELAIERKHRDETIGKLTGGMAHDFNNLLTVIIQSVELTKLVGGPLPAEVNQLLDASLKAAESGASIVNQLLAYARQQPLIPKHITVTDWLGSSRALFRQVVGKIAHFDAQETTGCSTLRVDSARLTTAIINLLANARDAIDPSHGRIELRISKLTLNLLNQAAWPESPAGEYVLFTVEDNGKGMTPEQLQRACEPFYSTKSQSAGTGLGLSSVQGFVKQSGGDLKLVSQIGVGTTVSFILPQVTQRVAIESSKPTPADGSFRRRVLLVEDQEQVRHVIGLSLRSMGLDVIEAANADDAIRLIQTAAPPHWVLSDVRMPGSMNGIQLRNWVLSHFADIPVILMSGYRENETELEPEAAFLQKPIKPLELRQAFGM